MTKFLDVTKSGSDAGSTFSRNRFGQYVRRRAVPVQPRTSSQLAVRSRMSANSAAWRALTDTQRADWKSLGDQITRNDSLGQSYTFNGFMAYTSVNNNKIAAGDAAVSTPPAIVTPGSLLTVTVTLTNAAFSIAYTATPLAAATRAFIYCSPQLSAGRAFNGDYKLISVTAAAAASPANILTAYTAAFGAPVTGNRIFINIRLYNSGFLDSPFGLNQVVA